MQTDIERGPRVIRVVLADYDPIARARLRHLLMVALDIKLVGEASDGPSVIRIIQNTDSDVVVVDSSMPYGDGLTALDALQQLVPKPPIISLVSAEHPNKFVDAMRRGCRGVLSKQAGPEQLVRAVRKVAAGETWLNSDATLSVMRHFAAPPQVKASPGKDRSAEPSLLTAREREIVARVAQGLKNREIAMSMSISEQTVKNHLHNIFSKLGASERVQVAIYAIRAGLVASGAGSLTEPGVSAAVRHQ
jgi:DNA-binding NarL/FixJ family response regulator